MRSRVGNPKRALSIALLALGSCCLGGGSPFTLSYARDVTGLALSPISDATTADDGEMASFVHGTLSISEARAIAQTATETVIVDGADTFGEFVRHRAAAEASTPRPGTTLHRFAGCTSAQAWVGLVDPETGEIWIEILYPDWAGDAPGCPHGAVHRATGSRRAD